MSHLIRTVKLRSGPTGNSTPLSFSPGSVTLFVGPNHSGKSKLLQEIRESIPNVDGTKFTKILGVLEFNPLEETVRQKFEAELWKHFQPFDKEGVPHMRFTGQIRFESTRANFEKEIAKLTTVEALRKEFHPVGHNLVNRLCLLLNGNERLNLLNATGREEMRAPMTTTLGMLFQDDLKRKEVQRIVAAAFGWHLVMDVTGKDKFRAAISEVEAPPGFERSLAEDALKYFQECADIATMSDGVRAFAGMISAVVASEAKLILIDEPEAFLHPALCANLANELCRKARETGRQLLVATHSAPFLLGCVQAGVDLNVVRLTYRNRLATSRIMEHTQLVPLMRNPMLRTIGLLNGIFYESVIVTEAEQDRAFYEEVNNRCIASGHPSGVPDCLFLNAQNWQTTKIIGPLRKIGIAAAVIVDVDIVCEDASTSFSLLLESAGIPEGTRQALGQMRGNIRPQTDEAKKDLKKRGMEALTGQQRLVLEDFITQLAGYGIFVVPRGELEAWLPNLPRRSAHKSEWLQNTFEAMGEDATAASYVKPANDDVWQFMAIIRQWLHNPNRRGIPEA